MKTKTVNISNDRVLLAIEACRMNNRLSSDDAAVEYMLLRFVNNIQMLEKMSRIGILDLDNEIDYERK